MLVFVAHLVLTTQVTYLDLHLLKHIRLWSLMKMKHSHPLGQPIFCHQMLTIVCLFFCLLDRSHCDNLQHQHHNHNFCYSFQRHQQDFDSIPHNADPNHKQSTRYYCHCAKATKEAGRSTDAVAKRTHPAIDLHLGLPGGHLFSLEGRDGVDQSFVGRCTDDCVDSG
ncbi:hypothetical protein F5H01DRAFT_188683 [Linnemannia elongata]|nr:hypothetical protein F5H01DRAFT_188683 [Linnemannia elongata]